jgi:hypothetical protein
MNRRIRRKEFATGVKILLKMGSADVNKFFRAGIAQLVEPHVANVVVAGSSPVSRSISKKRKAA